ncbi:anti-repressor protein [Gammaproteobacteria bacterium]
MTDTSLTQNIVPFSFESFAIRVIPDDSGNPWFVAADVCDALTIGNNRDAISRLDDDEKGVVTTDTLGGPQELAVINESGLYSLILTSRKPEAKKFKKWVTSEVLPTIRKTGRYETKPVFDINSLSRLDIARMLLESETEKMALAAENAVLLPKAELCDELLVDNETTYLIDTVAGMAPMDTNQLRNILKDDGWLKFSDGAWLPTAHVRHKAWMVVRLDSVNGTKFPCAAFTMEGISQLRHTQALSDLFKHVPLGQEIFRNGKIKVLQHEHRVVQ